MEFSPSELTCTYICICILSKIFHVLTNSLSKPNFIRFFYVVYQPGPCRITLVLPIKYKGY